MIQHGADVNAQVTGTRTYSMRISYNPPADKEGTSALHGAVPCITASVNTGAPTTGSPFPNTNPALFADQGETMAEVRNRVMCGGACEPSVDIDA